MRQYYVYIMTNDRNTALYTGVTNDLQRRVYEHKNGLIEGFTKKYNVTKLIWFESTSDISVAISKEKKIKGWIRKKKMALVALINPGWNDLSLSF